MIPDRYAWLVWSAAFLVPWLALYLTFPHHRRTMLLASAFTTPFGLTEPLFVPEYWDPPSLFDLAQRTGFDIERLIFCFGVGGIGAVLVSVPTRRVVVPLPDELRHDQRHRFHRWALASPFLVFVEELLFAIGFGGYWAGVYEHLTWRHPATASPGRAHAATGTATTHSRHGEEAT